MAKLFIYIPIIFYSDKSIFPKFECSSGTFPTTLSSLREFSCRNSDFSWIFVAFAKMFQLVHSPAFKKMYVLFSRYTYLVLMFLGNTSKSFNIVIYQRSSECGFNFECVFRKRNTLNTIYDLQKHSLLELVHLFPAFTRFC